MKMIIFDVKRDEMKVVSEEVRSALKRKDWKAIIFL
jgi:hypothetical protein